MDRGGEGSSIERTHFSHAFFVLDQEQTFKTIALGTETTRKGLKLVLSIGDLSPFCRQAFPLRFFIPASNQKLDGGKAWDEANGF